jgi:hypothetical protein
MPGERLLTASAYGRTVALRLHGPTVDDVRATLPHWWDASPAVDEPERTWTIDTAASAEAVVAELELWVAEHARDRVFVHAGVVVVDGYALLLPGRSFTGKSTMTRELLRAGAVYGSDEYAVLRGDGTVEAYPRPLALREHTPQRVDAGEFGATVLAGAVPVRAVAVLQYRPDTALEIRPITAASAVLRLFENTVCASSRPEESFETLVALSRDVVAVEGTRGEAAAAVSELFRLVRRGAVSV